MNSKVFNQDHYDEADPIGKSLAEEVAAFRGFDCIDKTEHKSKSDLLLAKGDKKIRVEAEVRTDKCNNFDHIGEIWDTIHVPRRKGEVAVAKNQLADRFLSFRKDGKFFWDVKMSYAVTFPIYTGECKKDDEKWLDDLHDVKIDIFNTVKYEICRDESGKIVELKPVFTRIQKNLIYQKKAV